MQAGNFYYFLLVASVFLIACKNFQQKESVGPAEGNYYLVNNWPQLPKEFLLGNPTGIAIDSNQNIFIFHRAGREWPLIGAMPDTYISSKTILMLDKETGKILNSWGDSLFVMPHGLTVDKNDNVWVTDVALHQIFKFNHEGRLLMKLGEEKVPGNDASHFNRPTDIVVASDGSFYVSDGYGNSRVIKFSSEGNYLFEWGKKGSGEGEFDIPHGVDLDENGNIYVADRENKRVQVFDSAGKFIRQWKNKNFGAICSVTYDKINKNFAAVDDLTWLKLKHKGSDVILFDSTGNLVTQFGRSGSYEGPVCWYHDISIDREGSIYVGDILGNKIQKFKKILRQ